MKKMIPKFSGIAIDQAHEQNNASVKGDSGLVCLTKNPAASRCWMVSSLEMVLMMEELEITIEKRKSNDIRHNEQTKHAQTSFT